MGSRGSGETASELFARRLDGRLADLRRRLTRLKDSDRAQRKHREGCHRVVLVGYTNAGKTSLMNALTSADLSVRDRPFETLDTTSRCLTRHGGDVILSDTVGFIRKLPERLFASFESTLAEATEASLLVVVVDSSDPEMAEHLSATKSLLQKLGAAEVPRFIVFNKIDKRQPTPEELTELSDGCPFVALSVRDDHAVTEFRAALLKVLRRDHATREIFVPYQCSEVTRVVYAKCRVIRTTAAPTGTQFVVQAPAHVIQEIKRAIRGARQ